MDKEDFAGAGKVPGTGPTDDAGGLFGDAGGWADKFWSGVGAGPFCGGPDCGADGEGDALAFLASV